MKVDDDTFIKMPKLLQVIAEWLPRHNDMFMIGQCENNRKKSVTNSKASRSNPYEIYCGGGAGYIITQALIHKLDCCAMEKCPKFQTAPDDVFVSNCAKELGAIGIYNKGFVSDHALTDDWITQHHIKPDEMIELFEAHGRECLNAIHPM